MGFIDNTRRLQTRILKNTTGHGDSSHSCTCKRPDTYFSRNRFFNSKKCYRKSQGSRCSKRFLQYLLPCSQKEWQNSPCCQSQTPQPVSCKEAFQNGHFNKGDKFSKTSRLGHNNRSYGCIFTHSNLPKTQKISKILFPGSVLPVESHVLRSDLCSSSFYKTSLSSCSIPENSECKISCLPGRLARSEPKQNCSVTRSHVMSRFTSLTRFHNQSRKIKPSTKSESGISRGIIQSQIRINFSDRGALFENSDSSEYLQQSVCTSSGFSAFTGSDGLLHRAGSQCSSVHASDSAASVVFLETVERPVKQRNSMYSTPHQSFTVVETETEHFKGSICSESVDGSNNHYRCIQNHVRGSYGESDHAGGVEFTATKLAYQPFGNGSNSFSLKTFSEIPVSEICINQIRQHDLCSVYQSPGGNSLEPVMHQDLGHLDFSHSESNDFKSCSRMWQGKSPSRPIEPSENFGNRMVLENGDSAEYFCDMGSPINGSVCIQTEQTDGNILHMVSEQSSICNRCSLNFVGEHVCICLSPNMSDTKSSKSHVSVSVRDNSDCSSVATQTLVHRSTQVSDCSPNSVTNGAGLVGSAKQSNLPSSSTAVSVDGMETVDRQYKDRGFSEGSRKLLRASWRKGTQSDYNAKYRKFRSWCCKREIDTSNISLIQVSDFLTDLFNEGLQYRTIAGYRSMLSVILPPVNGIKVGQHPDIVRLIKGVFNSRPPQKRLVPEWNLEAVLSSLQKKPFEPMKNASLKFITFKTVFLIAITCFRRCSDIQSLQLGEGSVNIQNTGITFSRHGLAKQDREGHYGTNIFIPAFKDNKKLDPKRCLYYYLKRTEPFRKCPDGSDEKRVFLSLNEPHKPVSSQTISNWIVQTLKLTLKNKKLKVKGHSTRALGSSYALYKGASLSSVLAAADWSRESTFVKYYLRDMSSQS